MLVFLTCRTRKYIFTNSAPLHWAELIIESPCPDVGYLPIMPVNARDSAGTSRDKQGQAGTSRDKAGTSRDKAGTNRALVFRAGTAENVSLS